METIADAIAAAKYRIKLAQRRLAKNPRDRAAAQTLAQSSARLAALDAEYREAVMTA